MRLAWARRAAYGAASSVVMALAISAGAKADSTLMLSMRDPFALAIERLVPDLKSEFDLELSLELGEYETIFRKLAINGSRRESRYDLVSVDAVWIEALSRYAVLSDLSDCGIDSSGFIEEAWASGRFDGRQLGIPIQPHSEVLLYRSDLFEALSIEPPKTTDDVIVAAARLHDSAPNRSGICWNGASGAAMGQTLVHFIGAFGGRAIVDGGPNLESPQAGRALDYIMQLVRFSPPDILEMAWDQRIDAFAKGRCAMTYGWTARVASLVGSKDRLAADQIGFVAAPVAPDVAPLTPLGVWHLAIPNNLAPDRRKNACAALKQLTGVPMSRRIVEAGVSASAQYAVLSDPEYQATYPVFRLIVALGQSQQLSASIRPPSSLFQRLTEVAGRHVNAALAAGTDPKNALRDAQSELLQSKFR